LSRTGLRGVESHGHEFFIDSDETAATAGRVKATFAAEDKWIARTIEEIDRASSAQEWLVERFGDRGTYSQTSELLLLQPDDMRQAIKTAKEAGYQPHDFAFFAHVDTAPKWETIETDPFSALENGVARHAAAWVAVEFR
jgi:hypothetical protein